MYGEGFVFPVIYLGLRGTTEPKYHPSYLPKFRANNSAAAEE